jgi:hypothetical protein
MQKPVDSNSGQVRNGAPRSTVVDPQTAVGALSIFGMQLPDPISSRAASDIESSQSDASRNAIQSYSRKATSSPGEAERLNLPFPLPLSGGVHTMPPFKGAVRPYRFTPTSLVAD